MNRNLRFSIWFTVIILAAFTVGYMSWAKATFNWPFDSSFTGQMCGGGPRPDGGDGCPKGYVCNMTGYEVDTLGTCIKI